MTDPYSGWKRNLAFVWLGVFVGLLGANFVFPFIPFYIEELGVTNKSRISFYTGITASVTGLSLTLTAPLWGSIADRYGRKPMLLRALIGAGLITGCMALVSDVWQLIALRFVLGAFAGTMGAAAALIAATTPRARVGYALGMLQTAVFSASMLGPVIGGISASILGIRASMVFCSGLFLTAAVLGFLFIREPKGLIGGGDESAGSHGKPKGGGLVGNLRVVLAERQILIILGFLFCLWLSTTYVRPVMPLSIDQFSESHAGAEDTVHLEVGPWTIDARKEAATGLVFGVVGLTSTIAALGVAPLGQRLGYRNCVVVAALLTGALYIPVALASSFSSYFLFFGALGLFQGAMVPGTNALIAASTPEGKQGSAFGLAASMQSMALLLGPLSGGAVAGLVNIEAVYVSIGILLVGAGAAAWFFIREPAAFREPLVESDPEARLA